MSSFAQRYAFPKAARFDLECSAQPDLAKIEAEENAITEAVARGYSDGLEEGRAAAEEAAKNVFDEAHRQGLAAGENQGLKQAEETAAALRQALMEFSGWRAELANQAESFCVDVVLAIIARLIELNKARVEFVTRAIREAIALLAPEVPHTIFVNPANTRLTASAFPDLAVRPDESIPPGGARIEAKRLLVESNVQAAFEAIKSTLLETRLRRIEQRTANKQRLADDPQPDAFQGADRED